MLIKYTHTKSNNIKCIHQYTILIYHNPLPQYILSLINERIYKYKGFLLWSLKKPIMSSGFLYIQFI